MKEILGLALVFGAVLLAIVWAGLLTFRLPFKKRPAGAGEENFTKST